MIEKMNALIEERNKVDTDQRALLDKADSESRSLNADETTEYENMDVRFGELTTEIDEIRGEQEKHRERQEAIEARKEMLKETPQKAEKPIPEKAKKADENDVAVDFRATPEYEKEFKQFIKGQRTADEVRSKFGEKRAYQVDDDATGGFIVAPVQFVADLIQDLKNLTFVRQFCDSIDMPNAQKVSWPVLSATVADSDWVPELQMGGEESTMGFQNYNLTPSPSAKYIKVSNTLLRMAAINLEALVRTELAYKFGITEEKAFLQGDGANKPLGCMIASDQGITTARDVSDGNTSGAIKGDNLINCKYKMEAQWRQNCRWIFHRDAIKQIRKLKDGDGTYLWKAGISSDRPDTILDYPVHESEYQLNDFSASAYVGILGDFSFYKIVTAMNMEIAVAKELYLATNQTGYFARMEVGGGPVREKAFVRVKLGT
jgi:HK97 family phage major capsid protein